MRNKRALIIVAALVTCLAIGSAEVASAKLKKKKIPTTISLAVNITHASPYAPYTPASTTFSGNVFAKGPSGCRKGRTVTVSTVGPTLTDSNGHYSISVPYVAPPGTYTASVAKRVIVKKKKGKKFICKKAVSPPVTVP